MSSDWKIEWTDATWNPVVGCTAVSPGCDHCYAAKLASGRLRNVPAYAGLAEDGVFTGEVRMLDERITDPLRWRQPKRIFVNSMSDLFHPSVSDVFLLDAWSTMEQAKWHQFQILTKRPQRMASFTRRLAWNPEGPGLEPYLTGDPGASRLMEDALENVWLGTSIESDDFTWRADHLRRCNAQVKFLSLEPLLGPLPSLDLTGIDWVIVGGESGPGARPMHLRWVRDIRDRCVEAGVPFLMKQWGEWAPGVGRLYATGADIPIMRRVGKKRAGRLLDGELWDSYPKGHTLASSR